MYGYPIVNDIGWKYSDVDGCFVPPGGNYTLWSHKFSVLGVMDALFGDEPNVFLGARETIEGPVFEPDIGDVPF